MEKAFETKTVAGIKLLFYPMGRDVGAMSDTGDFYGSFWSVESAVKYIKDGVQPLGRKYLTGWDFKAPID